MKFTRLHQALPLLATAAVLALGSSAHANEPRVHWHLSGGYSDPLGTTSDYLQGGYSFGGGVSISPFAYTPLDFRFDVNYSEYNASNHLLDLGQQATNTQIDGGTGQIWSVTANLVYRVPFAYGVHGYVIAGAGAYHTRIELTQVVATGGGYYGDYSCDPFSGYCYGGYADALVAANDVTKFGWNAGLGVEFALPYGNSWFIETRYHRISTANPIQYLPIEIGYRF